MTMQVQVVEGEDIDALIDCLEAEMQGPSVCGFDLEVDMIIYENEYVRFKLK